MTYLFSCHRYANSTCEQPPPRTALLVLTFPSIFNFQKAFAILDELIIAGELQESSKKSVLRVVCLPLPLS